MRQKILYHRGVIILESVSKRFRGQATLAEVSFRLDEGRTHVLLGSSGSGKTTLLRIIAGVVAPDAGSVTVDGLRVKLQDSCGLADRLGYMTQEGGLFPHLTVEQNAALVARVRSWSPAAIRARLIELAASVGIEPGLFQRFPSQLSGGQRQRVALIRALFLNPRYVLLDEPMGALDPIIRRELQDTLKMVFQQLKTTVILVTHDVGEAAFFGDTITLLSQGRVLQHGSFAELVRTPAHPYVTEFLMAQRPVPQLAVLTR
jgi:osmoprotectant transport system ATP-binding protein